MGEVSSKRENSGDRQAGRASGRPFRHSLKRNPASSNEPTLLVNYYRTVSRYRRIIVGTAFLGFASGVLLHLTTLPVYQARTSVDVQSLNGDFMNMRSVAPTNDGTGTSTDAEVQTQIKLMQSDTLMEHTAARMDKEPHPESVERKDLFSRWTRALHLSRTKPLPYQELIAFTAQNVKVKPLGLTRLFEVTCDSWDPDFSAKFCNTLIKEFQEEDLQGRATEAQKTSDWLTKQAEDVRIKADDLQKQLQASVGGDGLILSQDSNSVGEDRLREIQGELVKAKADRMEKEAQMAISNSSPVDTVPGVVNRPGYQTYQQKLTDLRTQVAQLVPPLTEENPKVIHLRSQIREMEAGLDRERIADTATMKNEYDAARHREALLAATYQATEANVSRDLGRAAQVSMLRREGEAEQQLYTTLQQRAKEAGFASAMQASTLHIVDVARTPASPISPRRGSAAVFGMVLGSMIGVGFAFFKDRNFEVLRMPGDSERFLNIQELGVIPAANIRDDGMRSMLRRPSADLSLDAPKGRVPLSNSLSAARWDKNVSIIAEAYRNATLSILLSEIAVEGSRTYVIASPNASDGKTSVTSNLGVALSRSRLRVLLIDGDLRRPALHTALNVRNDFGLRDMLRSDAPFRDRPATEFCKPTEFPNLWVLPSGTGNEEAVELLHSSRVRDLVLHLAKDFDVVLIDTPPMLHMADARIFASKVDGVILVLRSGVTMREEAMSAVELFERDRVHVVGTILNGFNPSKEGRGNYYKSYFRYKDDLAPKEEVSSR